ncbi:MAG: hypothetical protein QUV05_00320 [Phycisphaerae bacterium]|nr:hypothetical protein [Phycisphaerae bacterium]
MLSSRVFLHASERVFRVLIAALCTAGLLSPQGCGTEPPPTSPPMTLGERVNLATGDIGTEGGIIAVERPGDPLDGLKIEVPEGACGDARTFAVSYRPILGTAFEEDQNFVSPLITIDNDGGYAEQIIPVTIPIQVPDDHFAMAFYYDESTGELEAIPVLEQTPTYVTIATCHFMNGQVSDLDLKTQRRAQTTNAAGGAANLLVSSAPKSTLDNFNLRTDFLPGRDDWQMPNVASILTPLGNCTGMSVTAMWYFAERAQRGQPTLRGRYDNDEDALLYATPRFWLDDSRALRLVSVAQKDLQSRFAQGIIEDELAATAQQGAKRNFYSIALALYRTRKPQLIGLYGPSLDTYGRPMAAHAVVCYGIQGQSLLIADPNLSGDAGRRIDFNGFTFERYTSGQPTDPLDYFDRVVFYGKTALVRWDRVSDFWADLDMKSIGQEEFQYYSYRGEELEWGDNEYNVAREFEIDLTRPNYVSHPRVRVDFVVPRDAFNRELDHVTYDEVARDPEKPLRGTGAIHLSPGVNIIGFYLYAKGVSSFPLLSELWQGFDWVTFVYEDPSQPSEPSQPGLDLLLLKHCDIYVRVQGHYREPPTYDFQGPGDVLYDAPFQQQWYGTGSFEGNTFTATWTDRAVGADMTESGMLQVTVQPQTLLVTSFMATHTVTYGADVKTSVVAGGDVRMEAYSGPPFAGLRCVAYNDDVDSRLTELEYQVTRGPNEWVHVVPWTKLSSWDCLDFSECRIDILFTSD